MRIFILNVDHKYIVLLRTYIITGWTVYYQDMILIFIARCISSLNVYEMITLPNIVQKYWFILDL